MRLFFSNNKPPKLIDTFLLLAFTVCITYQPFILYKQIMPWELGIYLPSIQALFDGMIPYRDFFYLRGPFEVYAAAISMSLFGKSIAVLYYFFYFGTVAIFLILVWMGRNFFQTRFFYYLMVPVVIARTFPYVYYFNWGGLRYALGLLSLAFLVVYFKRLKLYWIYLSAFVSAAAFLTSVDVGVASIVGTIAGLILAKSLNALSKSEFSRCLSHYVFGLVILFSLYGGYLVKTNSFNAYIDSTIVVSSNITKVFDTAKNSNYPSTFADWILALVPNNENFKRATPIYLYLFFFSYMFYLSRKKNLKFFDTAFICTATYGLLLYCAAWRKIGNAQFEMALIPEKLLLFYLLEQFFFVLKDKLDNLWIKLNSWRFQLGKFKECLMLYGIIFLLTALIGSSFGYALTRFNKRFDAFKVAKNVVLGREVVTFQPDPSIVKERLEISSMQGLMVSKQDAEEYKRIVEIIESLTNADESVFFFPEHGMYNFIVNRPFVGRFAMANYAWFDDRWQKELVVDLSTKKPNIVVMNTEITDVWKNYYFDNQANQRKFEEIYELIEQNYHMIEKTQKFLVFQINS